MFRKKQKKDAHVCHRAYSRAFAKYRANGESEMSRINQLYTNPAHIIIIPVRLQIPRFSEFYEENSSFSVVLSNLPIISSACGPPTATEVSFVGLTL